MEQVNERLKWQETLVDRIELVAIFVSLGIMFINLAAHQWQEALTGLACIIWFILVRLLLCKPRLLKFRINMFIGFGFCACLFSGIHTGYLSSNAMIWIPSLPVLATVTDSRRAGAMWLVLCLLAITILSLADPSITTGGFEQDAIRFFSFFALTLVLGLVSLHFRALVDAESQARSQAQIKIKETNQRFEYMIQGNQSALWDWTDLSREEVYWSPQLYALLGYQDGEIPSTVSNFVKHIAEESREVSGQAKSLALKGYDRVRSVIHIKRKDGSLIWVRSSGFVIRSPDHVALRMVGSLDDITELKESEIALRAAKNQAEQANAAKNKFLSHMSHEMRSPLNGILGYAELLLKEATDKTQQEYASIIIDCSHSLIKLINDILDYAKIESGNLAITPEVVNIHNLVEEVAKLFAVNFKQKDIAFIFNSQLAHKLYKVDQFRVRQILTNLIGNAIKFTQKGGITVDLSESSDHMIHIKVKDTGVGIAPADQERIFDAFYQVRSPESKNLGGTGLGLTIVQQIVNLLGGEIKVESQPGIGTTFELFFKAESHGAINVVQPTEEDFSLGPVANLSVLVVDDSEVNLLLMQSILKVFGVEADTATNGEEAVMAFEKKYYELVFMDINMPRLDGLSATRKIRESNPESKIQIYGISANAFSEDKEKALSAGMTGYLTKPMTMSNIRNVLAQCRP